MAWSAPETIPSSFRVVGAHTDSPNLRIRPLPDRTSAGVAQLGVEVYGSPLLNSWLDRDLGLSGRVSVRGGDGLLRSTLLHIDEPLLRIPQLAIHLDRSISSEGLRLDPQQHLSPVWGSAIDSVPRFRDWLADRLDVDGRDVLGWDVMTHDLTPPSVIGVDRSMFASPRLDNLLSCHCAVDALTSLGPSTGFDGASIVVLFDHEEVGSETATGAAGPMLIDILESLIENAGGTRADLRSAISRSICLSADGAHATHPNHVHRSDPDHQIRLDGGPVIKHNALARYATDAQGAAVIADLASELAIPLQRFITRGDLPCGSTIGPITATRLGITTVDVGVAQWSMHSARELCGVIDPGRFTLLCRAFLAGGSSLPISDD